MSSFHCIFGSSIVSGSTCSESSHLCISPPQNLSVVLFQVIVDSIIVYSSNFVYLQAPNVTKVDPSILGAAQSERGATAAAQTQDAFLFFVIHAASSLVFLEAAKVNTGKEPESEALQLMFMVLFFDTIVNGK
jgi:hypothetical protein